MQTKPVITLHRHRFWIASTCLAVLALGMADSANAAEEKPTVLGLMDADKPTGVLRTLDGRIFLGVRDAKPDATGLMFRHANGAARVQREKLRASDQERFGLPEPSQKPAPRPPMIVATNFEAPQAPVLTFRIRTVLPASPNAGTDCATTLAHTRWPSHWSRPHYGLAYPIFPCRQAAERDFLITSGILPRPAGVQTWRLR